MITAKGKTGRIIEEHSGGSQRRASTATVSLLPVATIKGGNGVDSGGKEEDASDVLLVLRGSTEEVLRRTGFKRIERAQTGS